MFFRWRGKSYYPHAWFRLRKKYGDHVWYKVKGRAFLLLLWTD